MRDVFLSPPTPSLHASSLSAILSFYDNPSAAYVNVSYNTILCVCVLLCVCVCVCVCVWVFMFKCMYVCVCLTYTCVGVCMFMFSSTHREQGGGESLSLSAGYPPCGLLVLVVGRGVALIFYKINTLLMLKILAVKFCIYIIHGNEIF